VLNLANIKCRGESEISRNIVKKLIISQIFMFEPYAMKVARTVLRGGKLVKAYLSPQTLCNFTVFSYWMDSWDYINSE
jgi:hypothetical protein